MYFYTSHIFSQILTFSWNYRIFWSASCYIQCSIVLNYSHIFTCRISFGKQSYRICRINLNNSIIFNCWTVFNYHSYNSSQSCSIWTDSSVIYSVSSIIKIHSSRVTCIKVNSPIICYSRSSFRSIHSNTMFTININNSFIYHISRICWLYGISNISCSHSYRIIIISWISISNTRSSYCNSSSTAINGSSSINTVNSNISYTWTVINISLIYHISCWIKSII